MLGCFMISQLVPSPESLFTFLVTGILFSRCALHTSEAAIVLPQPVGAHMMVFLPFMACEANTFWYSRGDFSVNFKLKKMLKKMLEEILDVFMNEYHYSDYNFHP